MYQSDEQLLVNKLIDAGETSTDHATAMSTWMEKVSNLVLNLSSKVKTLEQRIQGIEKKDFTP